MPKIGEDMIIAEISFDDGIYFAGLYIFGGDDRTVLSQTLR